MNESGIARIYLKKNKEESLKRFHPWIFSGAVSYADREVGDGETVDVYTSDKRFIARGHCGTGSIAVRVLTFYPEELDQQWWNLRIGRAYALREALGLVGSDATDCYRLVHGEGDNLPGLVIDIYGGYAVVQAHSTGMYDALDRIAAALVHCYGDKLSAVYNKSEATLPHAAEVGCSDGCLFGAPALSSVVKENGLSFDVNWKEGQKTGFFIDQRDNRALVRRYAAGRDVLNTFCYTGGFSVYALDGGARSVESVDSSVRAVELAERNVALNFQADAPHKGIAVDAFDYLGALEPGRFDLIVLDPPAFAKHQRAVQNALGGYKRINAQALRKIREGGILFTFSCSQAIDREQFRNAVFSAAVIAGRNVRILHQMTQPADHPVNICHPEGEYLKGLVLYVE